MVENDLILRELVAEQVRTWPKTVAPKALLELLDGFARKVAAAALTAEEPQYSPAVVRPTREHCQVCGHPGDRMHDQSNIKTVRCDQDTVKPRVPPAPPALDTFDRSAPGDLGSDWTWDRPTFSDSQYQAAAPSDDGGWGIPPGTSVRYSIGDEAPAPFSRIGVTEEGVSFKCACGTAASVGLKLSPQEETAPAPNYYNEAAKAYEALTAIVRAIEGLQAYPMPSGTGTINASDIDLKLAQGETAPAPQDHEWALNEHPGSPTTWYYCRRCGVVQRADGGNKPCPGKHPLITMRGETAPAPVDEPSPADRLCGCGYRESLHRASDEGGVYCQLAKARAALASPVPAAEGLDVETLARETAAEVRRLAYDQVLLRYDAAKAEAIILAALRAVAEAKR